MWGSPARFRSGANERLRRLVGLISVPTFVVKPDSFLKHLTSDCARKTSCLFCRFSISSRLQEYRKIWVATLSDLFRVKCFLVPLREQSTLEEEQGFDCRRISLVSQRR
jgi:hypothetical protein